ncbi:MAG: azurin [Pseudomonadota bacterium]
MINRSNTFLGLVLFSGSCMAACEFNIEVGDTLQFDTKEIVAEKSCESVTITINHTGKLPAAAMGHNWVLSKKEDFQQLAIDSSAAGLDNNYVPPDDARVLANTRLVGGGESDSISFETASLTEDSYTFFCSFPGHWAVMKGTFKLN